MMKDFWDERYCGKEFVYGKKPNEYLNVKLTELHKGKILLPAEGEGRNAVYAAKLGWMVSAFDQSTNGKEKAEILAKKKRGSNQLHYFRCGRNPVSRKFI